MGSSASRYTLALFVLAAAFLVLDMWGHVTGAYHTYWWIDIMTHLIFSAWLTLLLLHPRLFPAPKAPLIIFIIVMFAGVGGEMVEFLRDTLYAAPRYIPLAQLGPWDTFKDIVDNGFGARA